MIKQLSSDQIGHKHIQQHQENKVGKIIPMIVSQLGSQTYTETFISKSTQTNTV